MTRLTNLDDADIAEISGIYDLELNRYQPIHGGDENSSFLLKGSCQDYVLTFYEKRSLTGVEQVVHLLRHLAANGFHTNRVLATTAGSYVPYIQGKPMILKNWIPGKTLRDSVQSDFRSIGRAIGELHQIPAPPFLRSEHPYGLNSMADACGHGDDLEYETWLVKKIAYLQKNFPDDLPQSFIHGDLCDDNIIYYQGRFQAIIDFGDACHYPRAYDIGSALFGACIVDGRLNVERAAGVLDGYQGLLRLVSEERKAVQFFAVYAGAAISAWHYLHTYLKKPLNARLDKYKQAATRAEQLFNLAPSVFDSLLN